MLLSCDFVFEEITNESIENFTKEKIELLMNYTQNGGAVTLKALRGLMQTEPDTLADSLDYLRDAPVYETASVGNQDFLLVHSGLDNFDENKKFADYTVGELIWAWPEITDEYFDDVITVLGHTPTMFYDHANKGKILKTKTWIDIDVGVQYGNPCRTLLHRIFSQQAARSSDLSATATISNSGL